MALLPIRLLLDLRRPRLVALTATMLASSLVLEAQPVRLPVYGARHTATPVQIDGVLDDAAWVFSPRVGEMRLIHAPDRRPVYPTEAAVTWDDTFLYVAFACTDPAPWARHTNRDDRLWEEEVVEVFLDPDGDGRHYAEFEVSPTNVVVDLMIPAPKEGGPDTRAWNAEGLQTAVKTHATGWVAEIAIPWRALAAAGVSTAPAAGAEWRVGLYRIKRPGGVQKAARIDALVAERRAAGGDERLAVEAEVEKLRADDEYSAWSVTRADRGFHDPERFGIVQFLRATPP